MTTRPLDAVTAVSPEQAAAAPLLTRHLADQGTRVIKGERPGAAWPAGMRPPWRSRPSWLFSVQMTASTRWRSQFGNGRGCFSS
jgi:crotonobetainyl-CoA:carnitine CoA-transferase CaiB-like acyl-CoA transferase